MSALRHSILLMLACFGRGSVTFCLCGFLLQFQSSAAAQEKKDENKEQAAAKLSLPLAAPAGVTTKLTVRGATLDLTSEVKTSNQKVGIKLIAKGKATVPAMTDAAKIGDTQVELELTFAEDTPTGDLPLTIVTPSGEASLTLPIVTKESLIEATGRQNSFAKARRIDGGKTVLGVIEKPRDVHVFRVELAANQKLTCEVNAARQGSPLDSLLTLYDAGRQIVATNDDHDKSRDAMIEFVAPSQGSYFISLIDAQDTGSAVHVYRMTLRVE
jgi:hypothetical protein